MKLSIKAEMFSTLVEFYECSNSSANMNAYDSKSSISCLSENIVLE